MGIGKAALVGRALVMAAAGAALGCDSPVEPDSRTGYIALRIVCDGSAAAPLRCAAETYCSGLYRCPDPSAEGRNVTLEAAWSVADPAVARLTGPGRFEAAGPGDTVIYASLPGVSAQAVQPISVFEDTAPLPTNEIFGSVWEAGKTIATGAIDGATVDVLDGLVAGRSATSGVHPPLPPGFFGPFGGAGYYRILGVPPGTYILRVTATGFVPQERRITVPARGSPVADFRLARQ